jgi:hypothetical protein
MVNQNSNCVVAHLRRLHCLPSASVCEPLVPRLTASGCVSCASRVSQMVNQTATALLFTSVYGTALPALGLSMQTPGLPFSQPFSQSLRVCPVMIVYPPLCLLRYMCVLCDLICPQVSVVAQTSVATRSSTSAATVARPI